MNWLPMRLLLFFALALSIGSLKAQDAKQNTVFWGFKPQYGFIIPHSNKIRDISQSRPYGLEVDYGWVLSKDKDWRRCNCYSKAGFSVLHVDFNNPATLGSSTSVIMFAEPWLNYRGDLLTSLRMGVGPSYLSKVYDRQDNPENLFFSNHLSFIIHLDLMIHYRLNDQWYVNIFGKYNHISNGGIDEPNKGMNFPTFGVGMDYMLDPVQMRTREPIPLKDRSIVPSLGVFATMKKVVVDQDEVGKRTFGFGVIGRARKSVSRLNALSLGVEYLWDGEILEASGGEQEHQQISFLAGHDLTFGKFVFSQYWGTYLYAPYYNRHFFQRYTLTYQLTGHLHGGVTLKAHAETAHNFNVLLNYQF
ncbi:MAG: acyloxyacyl hydrolase [Bacteroidales bacterium]|nr:acyloxyacyl hydrolase [Bacteroidales bacterium]